jgi:hypothetical protein
MLIYPTIRSGAPLSFAGSSAPMISSSVMVEFSMPAPVDPPATWPMAHRGEQAAGAVRWFRARPEPTSSLC